MLRRTQELFKPNKTTLINSCGRHRRSEERPCRPGDRITRPRPRGTPQPRPRPKRGEVEEYADREEPKPNQPGRNRPEDRTTSVR